MKIKKTRQKTKNNPPLVRVVFIRAHLQYSFKSNVHTTKGGSRHLEKSHKVWMMMMIVTSLMWAGAAEREHEREREREQPKLALQSLQNNSKQLHWFRIT